MITDETAVSPESVTRQRHPLRMSRDARHYVKTRRSRANSDSSVELERPAGCAMEPSTYPDGNAVDGDASSTGHAEDIHMSTLNNDQLPFPGFVETVFFRLHQTNPVRLWCLQLINWLYPLLVLVAGVQVGLCVYN